MSPYWSALFSLLIIAFGKYFYSTITTALNGNYYIFFVDAVIILQIITIPIIKRASIMQKDKNLSRPQAKSILQRKLSAIVVLALIVGAGLDLEHLAWIHSDRAERIEIMWFAFSVPVVVLAMILFSVIIKLRNETGLVWLCLFSAPASIVAMYVTYRSAIQMGQKPGWLLSLV